MIDHTSAAQKRIVSELTFGPKTAQRVAWEAWELSIEGPHLVRVTNASWGHAKADHSYLVGIEQRDGSPVPAECGCKADRFREDADCKHKVAVGLVGGTAVLRASVLATTGTDTESSNTLTGADKLRADGGTVREKASPLNAAELEDCDCENLSDEFPCWPCVRDGRRNLPE
jgi:hypothetical protein